MMTSQAREQSNEQLITRCETTRTGIGWEVGRGGKWVSGSPQIQAEVFTANTGIVCTKAPGPGQSYRTFRAVFPNTSHTSE